MGGPAAHVLFRGARVLAMPERIAMATKDQVAQLIVSEAQTRGHSRDECLAEMSCLYQESGWDETVWDATHTTYGIAQQDASYPNRSKGAAAQIAAFFDRLTLPPTLYGRQAERAVARIQALRGDGKAPNFSDFAILYRANHQARIFEQALRRAQIPYKVSGGQSFFDRAEIKDLCAWLRLLVNQDDDPAFLRAVSTPKRGIGHQTLGSLGEFAAKWKCSMFEALFAESLSSALSTRAIGSLHEFGRYVNDLEYRARHAEGHEAARALLMEWLLDIGYEQHLTDNEENEKVAAARWSNVIDFVDWIAKRCGGMPEDGGQESEKQTVLQVAQTISIILSIAERGDEQDQVTLTTLHASKGLEWPHVLLAGVNEGLLPFKAEDDDMTPERLQEERRLMYVGITRARQTLAVSTLRRRKKGRETIAGIPSRFIAEMKLHEGSGREDPREKLKRMRAELAAQAAARSTPNG